LHSVQIASGQGGCFLQAFTLYVGRSKDLQFRHF
jgi:hypothetical protein